MLSKSTKTTSWDMTDIADLTGQVAIVTGGNSGIGYFVCLELARKGAKVYLACRNEKRTRSAISSLLAELPAGVFKYLHFDLTSLRICQKAAETFANRENRLDILVNNASVAPCTPYALSEDGIEVQACNAIGHFALTHHLLPLMKKTSQDTGHARIVNITSGAHKLNSEPDFTNLNGLNQKRASSLERYGNSMLSIIIFNQELQKRLQGSKIMCIAVHPGLTLNRLLRSNQKLRALAMSVFPEKGLGLLVNNIKNAVYTPLYAATALEAEEKQMGGCYLVPQGKLATPHPNTKDPTGLIGQGFWKTCMKLISQPDQHGLSLHRRASEHAVKHKQLERFSLKEAQTVFMRETAQNLHNSVSRPLPKHSHPDKLFTIHDQSDKLFIIQDKESSR